MTKKEQIEQRINYLNRITGNPETQWERDENGRNVANVGSYYLSGSEQGYELLQIETESGAVNSVFDNRIYSLSELNEVIKAYIKGIQTQKG